MLEQLLGEIFNQSGLGAVSPLLLQFMPALKALALDKITDTAGNPISAARLALHNGSTSGLLERTITGAEKSSMYGSALTKASDDFTARATEGLFRGLGYSPTAAKVAAGGNLGRMISGGLDFFGMNNPYKSGTSEIASALYSRRHVLTTSPQGDQESLVSQAHSGRRILRGLTDAYAAGEFGRMGFAEVGGLASRLIQTGALDAASVGTGGIDSRVARLKGQIKTYSSSLDRLRDIVGTDMSKVLDSMDKLFGGTTVAMSSVKLEKITKSMQHAALITGTNAQALAQNAALGYSYIADIGGTQGTGVRMGLEASYYTSALPSDARLSKDDMRSATLMAMANAERSGESKNLAIAYVAWKQAQKKGSDTSMKSFLADFNSKNKEMTNDSLIASAYSSIKERFGNGITESQASGVFSSISQSEEVLDVQETEQLGSIINDRKISKLIDARKKDLTRMFERSSGLKAKYKTADAFIQAATDGDIYARSDVIHKQLNSIAGEVGGAEGSSILAQAGTLSKNFMFREQWGLGVANGRQAQEMMRSSRYAGKLREQQLHSDKLGSDVLKILDSVKGPGDIQTRLVATLENPENATVAGVVSAAFGVDLAGLKKLNSGKFKERYDMLRASVGPGSNSVLTGIRKLSGKPEAESEAKDRDAGYAKSRIAAETAIRTLARAKSGTSLSSEDRTAINTWLDSTEMEDYEKAVYTNIDVETAKKLTENNPKYP
jgi:hypothetical protein